MSKRDLLSSTASSSFADRAVIAMGDKKFPLVKSYKEHAKTPPKLAYKIIDEDTIALLNDARDMHEKALVDYSYELRTVFGVDHIYPLHPAGKGQFFGIEDESKSNEQEWHNVVDFKDRKLYEIRQDTKEGQKLSSLFNQAQTAFVQYNQAYFAMQDEVLNEPSNDPYLGKELLQGINGWYVVVNNPAYVAYTEHWGMSSERQETGEAVFNPNQYVRVNAQLQDYLIERGMLMEAVSPHDAYTDVNAFTKMMKFQDGFKDLVDTTAIVYTPANKPK